MSDKLHTAGELEVVDDGPGRPIYVTSLHAATGDICDLYSTTHLLSEPSIIHRKPNAEADAARIALTWNSHDDLVDALDSLAKAVGKMPADLKNHPPEMFGCLAEAKIILDKIGGHS